MENNFLFFYYYYYLFYVYLNASKYDNTLFLLWSLNPVFSVNEVQFQKNPIISEIMEITDAEYDTSNGDARIDKISITSLKIYEN